MQRYNFTNPLFLFKIEAMIRRFFIIFCLAFLTTCDDGDIISVDLEFDEELELCENFEDSYILFDSREDPNEALILIFPRDGEPYENFFENDTPASELTELNIEEDFDINETTVRFIYRTYNRAIDASDICSVVPPSDLTIREDYEANSGTVYVSITIEDDDEDGVPNEYEYGPGGIDNPQDTDGDGFPDYIDQDDDNDNVLTINELNDSDSDNDPNTNPLNTDGDDKPNYLDDDDDGDGVLTRLEDIDENENPRSQNNIVLDENGMNIYRYLYNHPTAMEEFADSGFINNTYKRVIKTEFTVTNTGIEIISATVIDFGTYETGAISFTTEID
ncbi:hypothetical protein [Winogradskyella pulchriflava]|uniref:Uncharacterized protein n=1 Tax=Winogradskyella pulchriflava TaxID=1110688 RepID=A0ABV6Q980_9FLAO